MPPAPPVSTVSAVSRATRTRVPGLDALRAVAVIAVVGYHLGSPVLGGGFLGVTLFFVLSGYLITRLLLGEIESRGSADIGAFWLRRLRRLLPAAYVVVIVSLAASMLFAPELLSKVRGDGFAALFYGSNWWMIFHEVSYFDSFGLPSPLAHLWTLAIEEQFYVAWPLVLLALLILVRKKDAILATVGGLVLVSTTLMAVLYDPATDPNRSYMGTDTRMAELLIGAFLALALHYAADNESWLTPRMESVLDSRRAWLALLTSSGCWLLLVVALSDTAAFAYRGGILIAAVASAGMILALQAPAIARYAVRVDRGLVGAVGRRSYSIYLWHYPVLVAFSTAQTIGDYSRGRSIAIILVTLLCAEASYRLVEGPVRRLGFKEVTRRATAGIRGLPQRWRRPAFVAAVTPALLACLALAGVNMPPPSQHGPTTVITGSAPVGSDTGPPPLPIVPRAAHLPQHPKPWLSPTAPLRGRHTVAIGDSLMINLAPALGDEVPKITINAEVGRQPWTGLEVAASYSQFNRPGGNYILGIGTNGAIDAAALARFCEEHENARVFLITPRVDRTWESTSVAAIESVARRFDNVRVVDFHEAAAGHPGYFTSDGVHLTSDGVKVLVRLIVAAATRPA
ncbi:acyltransferase family protein [Nocardioides stalactiti]|uniref:acyltransferase family protein n=1 Tax=Nocardioides stalactiti TaxID=2755356 RepID=UPI0016049248|nr:acyltransferase family protein [Nocardioides stalactiti]